MDENQPKKKVNLELIDYKINRLQDDIHIIQNSLQHEYISKGEVAAKFSYIDGRVTKLEKIFYGAGATIILAVIGALLKLVIL